MPTYEYECKSCGHDFETFQSMSDAPLKDCPECGGELRRLINGGGGVIFKGSGFYVTDKSGGKNAAKGTKTDTSGEGKAPAAACASCPASASSGGSCPVSQAKAG